MWFENILILRFFSVDLLLLVKSGEWPGEGGKFVGQNLRMRV